jgi:hypothetical protein
MHLMAHGKEIKNAGDVACGFGIATIWSVLQDLSCSACPIVNIGNFVK